MSDNLMPYLLAVLVVLVALCLLMTFLLLRRNRVSTTGEESTTGDSVEVLAERLASRERALEHLQQEYQTLQQTLRDEQEKHSTLREQLGRQETLLQQERKQHEEKLSLLNEAREKMSLEFRQLASEILEQKSKAFTESNRENIQNILNPLNEKIRLFEKKVEETYDRESKERFSLAREIKSLQELNSRISEDAINLTRALKGETKTQGTWGEVILERVLERSGLTRGSEYEVQVSLKSEDGRSQQPDVIVHLPEGKDVIIDAKVSLNAYERYSSESDEDKRPEYLKQHIQAIRNHIKTLSSKDYHRLLDVQSLDFVMMFLPVEAAFTLAVQEDNSLFTEAFERNIVLVGPSTLLATLRTIQNIWRYEHQNKNALDIAHRAGRLYDKFVAFAEDLETIGQRLTQTQTAYDQAHNKLSSGRGNLVSNVETLKKLGARASKQLPSKLLDDASDDPDGDNENGSADNNDDKANGQDE